MDPNKVRRNRNTERQNSCQTQRQNRTPLIGLFFDGRRDSTKEYVGGKIVSRNEEHISILQMPGSIFIGHVTIDAERTNSLNTSEELFEYLRKESISSRDMLVAGCDGCVANTGWIGGIIFHLERKLNRPLQWNICLLHFNELPLKNLIKTHDGRTTGPSTTPHRSFRKN